MSGVVVAENGHGRYQQAVTIGQHHLIADEPAHVGGNDGGPAPFDFLMSALGACTSITLRMYAERKGIALKRVSVELHHEKVDIDGKTHDHIRRDITLEGELTGEQRERMLEIANKSPLYRALGQPMLITSSLVE